MTNISRRNVAKGAAWSIPAVSVAASAPALATSPTPPPCTYTLVQSCPTTPMTLEAGSSMGVTIAAAGSKYKGGTYFTLNAGEWVVAQLPTYTELCSGKSTTKTASGYYLNWGTFGTSCADSPGTGPASGVVDSAGNAREGQITLSTPTACSPQTAGAGLASTIGVQTSVPYNGDVCDVFSKGHILAAISLPFTFTYLDGLTPIASCHYNLNIKFKPTGCQPNPATSYTITAA